MLPRARFHIGYHRADNFTGAPLPGYAAPGAWLRAPAAEALVAVQEGLLRRGLTLLIYDAYRPIRAVRAMAAWAERTGNGHLLAEGYIARRSMHSRGIAVDLTLVDTTTGTLLPMGTDWDVFHTDSHVDQAVGEAAVSRRILHTTMGAAGWKPYHKEWWHFSFPSASAPPVDVPYGLAEPLR